MDRNFRPGSESAKGYRRYVTAGLSLKHESPWTGAHHGWILGSQKFVDCIRAMVSKQPQRDRRREATQVRGLSIARVSEVVCAEYGIEPLELSERGSRHPARAAMAYLARRHTTATNGELTEIVRNKGSFEAGRIVACAYGVVDPELASELAVGCRAEQCDPFLIPTLGEE
jgi:hypothetical protein